MQEYCFQGGGRSWCRLCSNSEIPVELWSSLWAFQENLYDKTQEQWCERFYIYYVAAEGIKDKEGKYFTDSDNRTDSFGHQRLTGGASYVRSQLETTCTKDPDWHDFLQEMGIFIPDIYMYLKSEKSL